MWRTCVGEPGEHGEWAETLAQHVDRMADEDEKALDAFRPPSIPKPRASV